MGKSVIVTGATGLTGAEVIRQAIADNSIDKVTAIVRRPLDIQHPKLNVVIHKDFLNYVGLEETFRQHDACIWCLGISTTLVGREEYITLTYDYAVAAAKAMQAANPEMTFVFLSGMGADSTEKSRILFAWVKGKTENALQKIPFKHYYIARPGGIKPINPKPNAHIKEKMGYTLINIMGVFAPGSIITTVELSKAMLNIIKNGADKLILENKDLRKRIEK